MEFHEKLQELRKEKNLTQEQLAEQLYVSRTAISKWESGRGYPSIDSLKELSKFFGISLDDLLSGDEILTVAQEDGNQRVRRFRDLVFGLLDCTIISYLFLPIFGEKHGDVIASVSLLTMSGKPDYIKTIYLILIMATIGCGVLTLALQNCTAPLWLRIKSKISLGLSAMATLFFMMSLQPYAGQFTLIFMIIKALMLIKWV